MRPFTTQAEVRSGGGDVSSCGVTRQRWIVALAILSAAAALIPLGCAMSADDRPKVPEYSPYGRVLNEAGEPVVGATIASEPVSRRGPVHAVGVASGRDGRFVDHQIHGPGVYRITITADGFRSHSEVVHVGEDGWDRGELEVVLEAVR